MSTITVQISYNYVSKKLLVPKSTTVAQLTQQALEKFNHSGNGQLYYNDKALDSSLPLRLTNLINNSKLTLKAVAGGGGGGDIRVKFSDVNTTVISKIKSNATLLQMIEAIEKEHTLDLLSTPSHIVLMNTSYKSSQYPTTRLDAIVGNVNSAVIRMINEKDDGEKESRRIEQQEIVNLQLKQQEERIKRLREEKENEKVREKKRAEEREYEKEVIEGEEKERRDIEEENGKKEKEMEYHESTSKPVETAKIDASPIVNNYERATENPIKESPQLYIPGQSTPSYENPNDDYNMTISQAQTYHKLIQDSGKKKKKLVAPPPSKYLIRIKFPDRSILQINFVQDVDTIKFGQLIKKIDTLLLPQYINNYDLKFGYPPFARLAPSFKLNDTKLVEMPDFQSERIVLIWETQGQHTGPFIKKEEVGEILQSNEMPEVVLESHRSELPDEKVTKPTERKLPKWFKK